MLIRSQDKKRIVNINNVDSIVINGNENRILAFNGYSAGVIGEYSTEKKAIKVLDMIQELYSEFVYSEGGKNLISGGTYSPYGFGPPKVFQMPQDDEVYIEEKST